MSGSSAEYLAGIYGEGMTVQELAGLLPRNACVIDIASGLSNFGLALATLRQDIRVVNLDIQYDDHSKISSLLDDAPANLSYLAADALKLPDELRGQFDYAFSYNFYSHVMRAGKDLGASALAGAVELLKPHGSFFVGPTNSRATSEKRWNAHVVDSPCAGKELNPALIAETAKILGTPKWLNPLYNAMYATGIGIYPRRRFEPGTKGWVLSTDSGKNITPLFSGRGFAMALRLGWQTAREVVHL